MSGTSHDEAVSFERVLADELADLRPGSRIESLEPGAVKAAADEQDLVGLAFSGGGIRSATFNLGMLQGLARLGLLEMFDYLSTVSGGGYIGSWLQAWLHRTRDDPECDGAPIAVVQAQLAGKSEPSQVRFLREYSNYLTPRVGLLSGDTWTIASIYLRNLLLNLVVTASAIASALLALKWFVGIYGLLSTHAWWALCVAVGSVLIAVVAATANLTSDFVQKADEKPPFFASRTSVLFLVVVPILLSTWTVGAYAWGRSKWPTWRAQHDQLSNHWWLFAGVYIVSTSIPAVLRWRKKCVPSNYLAALRASALDIVWVACATLISALLASVLFYAFGELIETYHEQHMVNRFAPFLGPLLLALCVGIVMAMQVGISGNALSEQLREWQARLAGLLIGSAVLLSFFSLIATIRYDEIRALHPLITGTALPAWLATSAASAWAGRATAPSSGTSKLVRAALMRFGPYVFALGLLIAIAVLANAMVALVPSTTEEIRVLAILGLSAGSLAVSALLSLRFGINDFSIGALYRNRLVRCYLGAIRKTRSPNLFTGLAEEDDLTLLKDLDSSKLDANLDAKKAENNLLDRMLDTITGHGSKPHPARRLCRPYAIYNATLNLVGGAKLAWQQRRARPFVFTPKYCGFALSEWDRDLVPGRMGAACAFRPTAKYAAGIPLGTAMSISGAAVSSSMGERTTPVLSFLLTIFNLRLGRWLPNPKHPSIWKIDGPRFGLGLLVKELLGMTGDEQRYVYLSDGGHFENLGIFELIRRRCRFVVACDAGQDARHTFEDLGNAIERVRTDLGVEIEIDLGPLQLDEEGRSRARCAIGRIHYDENTTGVLVYIKSTLTGCEPSDVTRYAKRRPAFPHEPTADQWFDETQFESYRRLGEQTATDVFAVLGSRRELRAVTSEKLFLGLAQRWRTGAHEKGAFSRHAEELNRIIRSLRGDKRLDFLALQVFPDLWHVETRTNRQSNDEHFGLPKDGEALRAGFYACHEMVQLMETVYLELELETQFDHPDNRGWITLFRRWAWSSMFRVTWGIIATTFGVRFQTFSERRFGLGCARLVIRRPLPSEELASPDIELRASTGLNFFELELLRLFAETSTEPFQVLPLASVVECPASAVAGASCAVEMNCAFAVLRGKKLILFRVQDHARKMGIARRALELLLREGSIDEEPALETFCTFPAHLSERVRLIGSELITDEDRHRFNRLFQSVLRDRKSTSIAVAQTCE